MKKLIFCIISMMLCFFYSSCIKPEPNPSVFTVSPNGTDDTENMKKAFDKAIAYGEGATVQLSSGQYYVNMFEIHQFKGVFKGAGKDKTFIDAVPNLPCAGYWANNNQGSLVTFLGGDVIVSDMTFKIHDGFACADENEPNYGRDLYCILMFADYSETYRPDLKYIKAAVKDVNIIGGNDDGSGGAYIQSPHNTLMALWGGADIFWPVAGKEYPLTQGEFSFQNCSTDNIYQSGEGCLMGKDCKFQVSNSVFKNSWVGWYFTLNLDCQISFNDNSFNNIKNYELLIDDSEWGLFPNLHATKRTIFNITGNQFSTMPGTTSITTTDARKISFPEDLYPMDFTIKNNNIALADSAMGIMSLYSHEEQIINNTFTGNGSACVFLDGDTTAGFYAEDALISSNNFSGATNSDVHVYLGTGTRNCTVNAANTDIVIDNGTSNTINGGSGRYGRLYYTRYFTPFHGIARKNMMLKRKP